MGKFDRNSFLLCHRLWRLSFRWILVVQTVVTVVVIAVLLVRLTTNVVLIADFVCGALAFAPATLVAIYFAVRHWYYSQVRLTAVGLYHDGTTISWGGVSDVRRRYSLLSGWVFEVESDTGGKITLPAHPGNPGGFREAVERFAGPDHPLVHALASDE